MGDSDEWGGFVEVGEDALVDILCERPGEIPPEDSFWGEDELVEFSQAPAVFVEGDGRGGIDPVVVGNPVISKAQAAVGGVDSGWGIFALGEAAPGAAVNMEVSPTPGKGVLVERVVPSFAGEGARRFIMIAADGPEDSQ
jgi:hypothetical protein